MRPCPLLDRKNITTRSMPLCCNRDLLWQHTNLIAAYYFFCDFRAENQWTYLVLVLQPASCCSWMRAANCCRSATSLPWACLMKGCSRRWVTDGRASKSFIRHLKITKTGRTLNTWDRQSFFKLNRVEQLRRNWCTWALWEADLSGSVRTPAGNSLQVF